MPKPKPCSSRAHFVDHPKRNVRDWESAVSTIQSAGDGRLAVSEYAAVIRVTFLSEGWHLQERHETK